MANRSIRDGRMGGYMGTGPMTRVTGGGVQPMAAPAPAMQRPVMPVQPLPGGAPLPAQPLRAGPAPMLRPAPAPAPMPMQGATGPGTGAPGMVTVGQPPGGPVLRR